MLIKETTPTGNYDLQFLQLKVRSQNI